MSPSSEQPDNNAPGASDSVGAVGTLTASARVVRPEELLEGLLAPVVESMGYELVHTEFSGTGKHRRLAIFLDGLDPDGVFSLNDCAKMAPIVSSTLDAAEADPAAAAVARVLKAPYVLEVSSPGIDRPLAKLSHFRRHIGGLAKVTTFSALDAGSKQKNFNGRIEDVQSAPHAPEDDRAGTVTLVDPDGGAHQVIDLDQIRRAHLVYEG
ncbi:MAG: ribosome maturation factor RimP [Nannocystaceae bacterium]|nr:ribosome maturation factor RimP [Nannocystaceae bacterium]